MQDARVFDNVRAYFSVSSIFIDVDCTDLDDILDNCQFHPYCLTRETLAAEAKSSAENLFVL
jgi:hypothetical protein